MTNMEEYELHVLNELIVATLDSAKTYHDAVLVADPQNGLNLTKCIVNRMEAAERLQRQVRAFDCKPANSKSILAAAHHAANGEPLQRHFEAAINDERISEPVRYVIRTALERIGDDPWAPTTLSM